MDKEIGVWGYSQLMATAAVRYCLGRRTYIVSCCVEWLFVQWENFDEHTKALIKRDIEEEIERDDEARANGCDYKPLGDDMDRAEWLKCRQLWEDSNVSAN